MWRKEEKKLITLPFKILVCPSKNASHLILSFQPSLSSSCFCVCCHDRPPSYHIILLRNSQIASTQLYILCFVGPPPTIFLLDHVAWISKHLVCVCVCIFSFHSYAQVLMVVLWKPTSLSPSRNLTSLTGLWSSHQNKGCKLLICVHKRSSNFELFLITCLFCSSYVLQNLFDSVWI